MTLQSILISLILGLGSNLDHVLVGLTFGTKKVKITWLFAILLSFVSFSACWFAGSAALAMTRTLPIGTSRWLGSGVFLLIGLWMFTQQIFRQSGRPFPEVDAFGFSEVMFIALTDVMADFVVGFGAGFSHDSVFGTSLAIGVLSGALLVGSTFLQNFSAARKFSSHIGYLSGLLLIGIALFL